MKQNKKETAKQEARANLLANYITAENPQIGIAIKSVSQSGMSRRMRVYSGGFNDITYLIAELCDLSMNDKGLLITGCGMDMTFWLANHITFNLWPYKYNDNNQVFENIQAPEWANGNGSGSACLRWRVL